MNLLCRGAAKDGGTLEYVFDAGEQNSPDAITKEKSAEIAADFMATFYHLQIGALDAFSFLAYFEYALVLPEERYLIEVQKRKPDSGKLRGQEERASRKRV